MSGPLSKPFPVLLNEELRFPRIPSRTGLETVPGLLAIGGDLSVQRLKLAYRSGFFPWSVQPITWWSPHPRAVLPLEQLHISRSLKRVLRQGRFRVTRDQAFAEVIRACAEQPRGPAWISPEFIDAYGNLHQAGYAHSVECWMDDRLVGGIYGVQVGGLFAGESMFYKQTDASKVALCHLVHHLRDRGFSLFDVQMTTPTTAQLGAIEIDRQTYLQQLKSAINQHVTF